MNDLVRNLATFVFFLIFAALPATANAGFLCDINPWCKAEAPSGSELRTSQDAAADPAIGDKARAEQSANTKFQFFKLADQNVETGYVRVEYDFVGRKVEGRPNETTYDDAGAESVDLFKQSILDWAKSLFVTEKRTYLVTLTAKSSDGVFWTEPIISFEYENGFNIKKISDSFRFNGSSTFYRKFDEEIEVSLDILHAKTTDIDTTLIGQIFDGAGALSAALGGPVFSVVDIMSVGAYRSAIDSLKTKLSKFQQSKTLSRKMVLKYENDRYFGFQYHFLAPTTNYTPFKLNVVLTYKNSLLDGRIIRRKNAPVALESAAVLTLPVKPKDKDAGVQTLRNYFSSNPYSSDVQAILASASGSGVTACGKLTQAAAEIFQPHDMALAKLAYVLDSLDRFGTKKDADCFRTEEKIHLADYGLKLPSGFENTGGSGTKLVKLRPMEKYFNQYLEALGILIKYAEDQRDAIGSSITQFKNQAKDGDEERPFRVNDQASVFIAGGPRQIFPTDMVDQLLKKKFDQAGCFERSIYSDNEADPNVVGILFGKTPDLYEAVVHFDKKPVEDPQPNNIKIDLMEFRNLTPDALRQYEKAYDSKPCKSGWSPWKKAGP